MGRSSVLLEAWDDDEEDDDDEEEEGEWPAAKATAKVGATTSSTMAHPARMSRGMMVLGCVGRGIDSGKRQV